jgi:hypothetical protein
MRNIAVFILGPAACLGFALSTTEAQTAFTKITSGAIVTDKGTFAGPSWVDVNHDGYLDLIVGAYGGENLFYTNNGDGTFTKIVGREPVQDSALHTGAAMADYDNDGAPDMVMITGGNAHNIPYHNDGSGTFARVGGAINSVTGSFNVGGWADYDGDGLADFIVGVSDSSRAPLLFHNDGNGLFHAVTDAGLSENVSGASLNWIDYNNDGFLDLIIPGYDGVVVYRNNGNGTFAHDRTNTIATDSWPTGAWCVAAGDYDNDGLADLFVTGADYGGQLYHNEGNGGFKAVPAGSMLAAPDGGESLACTWGDYDNDGYLDLFISSHGGRNRLFHNNGDGSFSEVIEAPFTGDLTDGIYCNASSFVDIDNDGFLDLFITRYPEDGTVSNLLYHNNRNTNAWLEVRLDGRLSNRSGIGAKIRVQATIGGKQMWQMREISSGGRDAHPLVAHFGLGNATNIDLLKVEWPSGVVQTLTNLPANRIMNIVEQQKPRAARNPSITDVSRSIDGTMHLSVSGDAGYLYVVESTTNLANWSWLGVRTNTSGTFSYIDSKGTNQGDYFYRVSIP